MNFNDTSIKIIPVTIAPQPVIYHEVGVLQAWATNATSVWRKQVYPTKTNEFIIN